MSHDDDTLDGSWGHHARARDRKHDHRKKKNRTREALVLDPSVPTRSGTVLATTHSHATVWIDGVSVDVRFGGSLRGASVAVGDEVSCTLSEPPVVRRVLPRRTALYRRSPHRTQPQVALANVDVVAIVGSASTPPFRPGLVDRYLLAIHAGGARPVVVVTKADEDPEHAALLLEEWRALGVDAVACSAHTREGLDELLALLGDGRAAFVGHSGVGKSSLLAALLGEQLAVGDLTAHGRGRHTTTAAELHQLPGGGQIIDTPGVRAFDPWEPAASDLAAAFPDVAAFAGDCGFSSCSHAVEEDCGVLAAVDQGRLDGERLRRFQRLRTALEP